jgi:hypothetical protein
LKQSHAIHPVGPLLFGLLITQVLATIQVYLSNLNLYVMLAVAKTAGYLTVPNQQVAGSLQKITTAFLGGLFFTFSIGAGICLASLAAAWIWRRVFAKSIFVLVFFLCIWAGLLIAVNIYGWSVWPSLYFFLVPPILFTIMLKGMSQSPPELSRTPRWMHIIPIPLLALLWFTQFDGSLLLDLRDNLLWSNLLGNKFMSFYYRYTLYPAQAFKALDQKTIRTCQLEHIASPALYQNINKTLLDYDYLPVNAGIGVDAIISNKNTELVFKSRGCELFQIPISRFLSDPATALHHLSRASDRHSVFRYLTFVSLLIGFPIVIYLFLHALLYYLFLAFSNPGTSALLASVMCFLIGFATFAFFQTNRIDVVSTQNVAAALGSTRWQVRVAALKAAGKNRLDISRYRGYPALLKSPVVPQRYWLARALAVSRGPGTYRDLLHLLNDANINVRCMAMYAFGQRKNPQAIGPILAKLQTSGHWYSQLYAYRALRSLGWKQRRSP